MFQYVHPLHIQGQHLCAMGAIDDFDGFAFNDAMTDDTDHFLREWRLYRDLSQDEVAIRFAEIVAARPAGRLKMKPLNRASISRIENGKQPYKQQHLDIFSEIYQASRDELITINPMADNFNSGNTAQNSDSNANGFITNDSRKTDEHFGNIPLQAVRISHYVPILGFVEAGAWREMDYETAVTDWVPIDRPEYRGIELFSRVVSGPSMNKVFPNGARLICASPHDVQLRNNDYVIVRRTRNGTAECTVKQFEKAKDGAWRFWPRSTDPKHQEAFAPAIRDEHAQDGWEITGIVLDWLPEKLKRLGEVVTEDRLHSEV